jgi:hypothetical protein
MEPSSVHEDAYVAHFRASRDSRSVLKLRLIQLRQRLPDTAICVFEGDDDKIVYSQWIRRVRSDLDYEPFPCGGKEKVLRLRDAVQEDVNELGRCVFFFVDRDFDDLQGRSPGPDLFMTDRYSVENYVVTDTVLNDILKNEFQCHANPDVRQRIIDLFRNVYMEFLTLTRPLNQRLFAAKLIGAKLGDSLPKKVGALAVVSLDAVQESYSEPESLIKLPRELSSEEKQMVNDKFELIDPRSRFRGKFALLFFQKWLFELCNEYAQRNTKLFNGISATSRVRQSEFTLGVFASKAEMPSGFHAFAERLCPPIKRPSQNTDPARCVKISS